VEWKEEEVEEQEWEEEEDELLILSACAAMSVFSRLTLLLVSGTTSGL